MPLSAVVGYVLAALNNGRGVRLGQEDGMRPQTEILAVIGTEVFPAARKADVLVQACVLTESEVWYCTWACHLVSKFSSRPIPKNEEN